MNTTRLPPGSAHRCRSTTAPTWSTTRCTRCRTRCSKAVIVVLVLLLFLGSVRAALLTAITIPLSLLFAFVCMHFTGIPANLLSLGALDFGIIVDGTLVMVEHIVHTICRHRQQRPGFREHGGVLSTIRDAALEVERPIFFSLLIIISAYIPLFTLERVERTPVHADGVYRLLRAARSMLLALTLIPVLATYLFRNGAKTWDNPSFRARRVAISRALDSTLRRAAGRLRLSHGGVIVLAVVCPWRRLWVSSSCRSSTRESSGFARIFPPGISLEKSARDGGTNSSASCHSSPEVQLVARKPAATIPGRIPMVQTATNSSWRSSRTTHGRRHRKGEPWMNLAGS